MWLGVAIQTGLFVLFAVGIYLWVSRQQRHMQLQQTALEKQLEYATKQWAGSQHEVEELRAGVIGVGQRVLQLDTALNQLSEQLTAQLQLLADKQQALELTDPESKIYSRAMKMVQLGADLDEIIRECELPRAEAELLFNLHQQKKQG